jgi:hypothetical protein
MTILKPRRIPAILYWGLPPALCLALYWPAFYGWFFADDFAFLGLFARIASWTDLLNAVFHPTQHGTWRPLSDRIYFFAPAWLFGIENSVPLRVIAFLAQFANLGLISAITRRITGSEVAGLAAPILWVANSRLATVMVWNCGFDYLLSGLCILAAFWLFLRHTETNDRRYLMGTWAVFLTGFLALETNIAFPALAAGYALCFARPHIRKTIPLLAASAAFAVIHQWLVPKQVAGPYAPRIDASLPKTLWRYWAWIFEPANFGVFSPLPRRSGRFGVQLFTVVLIALVLYQVYRRNPRAAYFLGWFLILVSPFLPFPEHLTDYYVTLPAIGVAMLAAHGIGLAFERNLFWKSVSVLLAAFYLAAAMPSAFRTTDAFARQTGSLRPFVLGVARIHKTNPDKIILLTGVDGLLFNRAMYPHHAFRAFGVDDDYVYLAPGTAARIHGEAAGVRVEDFELPEARARAAQAAGRLAVYRVLPDYSLSDITGSYTFP